MYFNNKFFHLFSLLSNDLEKNWIFYAVPILKSPFKTREKVELLEWELWGKREKKTIILNYLSWGKFVNYEHKTIL